MKKLLLLLLVISAVPVVAEVNVVPVRRIMPHDRPLNWYEFDKFNYYYRQRRDPYQWCPNCNQYGYQKYQGYQNVNPYEPGYWPY